MALLLPLQPIGLGDSEVECFSSYFDRLAHLHGYTRTSLIQSMMRAYEIDRHWESLTSPGQVASRDLHRINASVKDIVHLTQRGTENYDLERMTLLPVFCTRRHRGEPSLRNHRAWCERCFEEDTASGSVIYDRLLWNITFVLRCPFHKVLLRSHCPSCGEVQLGSRTELGPGFCNGCGSSLVGPYEELTPELRPSFGEAQSMELVSAVSAGAIGKVNGDSLSTFFRDLRGSQWAAPIPGHCGGRSGDSISTLKHSTTLAALVGTACKYDVSIVTLISDPEAAARQVARFDFGGVDLLGRSRLKVQSQRLQSVRLALEHGLLVPDGFPVPTIAQLGALFGMKSLAFTSEFPDLTERYLSRTRAQTRRVLGLDEDITDVRLQQLILGGHVHYLTNEEMVDILMEDTGASRPHALRLLKRAVGPPSSGSGS